MPITDLNPLHGADWFAARALLASRRLLPLAPLGLLVFALLFTAILALQEFPVDRAGTAERVAIRSYLAEQDTFPLVAAAAEARSELALRDSALQAFQLRRAERAAVLEISPESARARDSLRALLAELDEALDRATKAPLAASYRSLANTGALRTMNGVQDLLDTLDTIERARRRLGPVEAPQSEFAQLTRRANATGAALHEIAQGRRAAIVRQMATVEGNAPTIARGMGATEDSIGLRLARDSVQVRLMDAEVQLREARQRHVMEQARADSAASARAAQMPGVPPAVAALAAVLVAVALIFTLTIAMEARRPTIANAREAERVAGVPVLGTAHPRHLPREGRTRLGLGAGIDPFQRVYLALTASGTRERTVCISGDDPDLVAAVVGRLAVSAAADERATLVVDVVPGTPSAARYFGERHEPGFSEAIAAVRLWREVARPVGVSAGLGLDIVPAGARRADTGESVAMESNRHEFHLFASEYDFTVVAAPTRASLATALVLWNRPATIYVARIAQTRLATLATEARALQGMDLELHGVLLVDNVD